MGLVGWKEISQRSKDTKIPKDQGGGNVYRLAVPDESGGDPEECRSPSKGTHVKEWARSGRSPLGVANHIFYFTPYNAWQRVVGKH